MKDSFPNWAYFHHYYCRKEQLNGQAKIPESAFQRLSKVLEKSDEDQSLHEWFSRINTLLESTATIYHDEFLLTERFSKFFQQSKNEFTCLFNMNTMNYSQVKGDIYNLIGVAPENFNLSTLLGDSANKGIIHPNDINHYFRFALCTYLVIYFYGFTYESDYNVYQVQFRAQSKNDYKDKLITKKSYLVKSPKSSIYQLSHIDIWNVGSSSKGFRKVQCSINIPNDPEKAEFQNQLISIWNAILLSFTVKEVFFLNIWFKHTEIKDLTEAINTKYLKKSSPVTGKSISDFVYRLKKKIKHSYGLNNPELTSEEKPIFYMADELGLLDFNSSFMSTIAKIQHSNEESLLNKSN